MISQATESRERISERMIASLISSCTRDADAIEVLHSLLEPSPSSYLGIIPKRSG
ncbi:MAG: hypothetical protein ABIF01_01740 [Candidatus Micrarchaeota archaeon]